MGVGSSVHSPPERKHSKKSAKLWIMTTAYLVGEGNVGDVRLSLKYPSSYYTFKSLIKYRKHLVFSLSDVVFWKKYTTGREKKARAWDCHPMWPQPCSKLWPEHILHEADGLPAGRGDDGSEGRGRELGKFEVHADGQLETYGIIIFSDSITEGDWCRIRIGGYRYFKI